MRILCVGLTPALQQTMEFPAIDCGEVNRAATTTVTVAGKAANVARVLHTLGSTPLLTGFNGGDSGRRLAGLLAAEGIRQRFVACPHPTRTCVTVVERKRHRVTELVEEATLPGPAYWRELRAVIDELLRTVQAVAVSGNLPPSAPTDFYAWVAARANRADVPLVIDSSQNALIESLPNRPLLAKLNRRELAATFGRTRLREADVLRKAKRLCTRGAVQALITDGARGAWLASAAGIWHARPPAIEAVNPIGSGDAVTAGFLHAWLTTRNPQESLRIGVACGTANALTRTPGDVRAADVRAIATTLSLRKIS